MLPARCRRRRPSCRCPAAAGTATARVGPPVRSGAATARGRGCRSRAPRGDAPWLDAGMSHRPASPSTVSIPGVRSRADSSAARNLAIRDCGPAPEPGLSPSSEGDASTLGGTPPRVVVAPAQLVHARAADGLGGSRAAANGVGEPGRVHRRCWRRWPPMMSCSCRSSSGAEPGPDPDRGVRLEWPVARRRPRDDASVRSCRSHRRSRAGEILIAEFKTGPQNPDFRHALAQAIDSGADLWGMSPEEFEATVAARYFASVPARRRHRRRGASRCSKQRRRCGATAGWRRSATSSAPT